MKITKRQLKRIIREEYSRLKSKGLISEMYTGGSGDHQGHAGLGSERKHSSQRSNIGKRGFGWADFQGMAQKGDYDGAGAWLKEYASDQGISMLPREVEDMMIEFAQDEYTTVQDLQSEFNALVDEMRYM